MSDEILRELAAILEARKQASPDSSYVARLYARGLDAILKKVGEEACTKPPICGFIPWSCWPIRAWARMRCSTNCAAVLAPPV